MEGHEWIDLSFSPDLETKSTCGIDLGSWLSLWPLWPFAGQMDLARFLPGYEVQINLLVRPRLLLQLSQQCCAQKVFPWLPTLVSIDATVWDHMPMGHH